MNLTVSELCDQRKLALRDRYNISKKTLYQRLKVLNLNLSLDSQGNRYLNWISLWGLDEYDKQIKARKKK